MRSHIVVHRATTNSSAKSFSFRSKIEEEGLPRGSMSALETYAQRPVGKRTHLVLRKKSVRGYSSREILLMSMGLPFLVRLWHPAALCESFLPYCP
jgi:hypothetical protein